MTIKAMSLVARRELISNVRQKYRDASWVEKGKMLNEFVVATGYDRKHAIQLLNPTEVLEKILYCNSTHGWGKSKSWRPSNHVLHKSG